MTQAKITVPIDCVSLSGNTTLSLLLGPRQELLRVDGMGNLTFRSQGGVEFSLNVFSIGGHLHKQINFADTPVESVPGEWDDIEETARIRTGK